MKRASMAQVKAQLSAYVKASANDPVVVTRNGRPVAVLIGVENEAEVKRLTNGKRRRLSDILEKSRQQIREGKGLSHKEFWAEVARRNAVRQMRKAKSAGKTGS